MGYGNKANESFCLRHHLSFGVVPEIPKRHLSRGKYKGASGAAVPRVPESEEETMGWRIVGRWIFCPHCWRQNDE